MGEIEELRRVNAELAAELRALAGDRAAKPRTAPVPAARGVARLLSERDSLSTRLQETEVALDATRADRNGLERQNREMATEIARLSAGFSGFLRRLRGRLLQR